MADRLVEISCYDFREVRWWVLCSRSAIHFKGKTMPSAALAGVSLTADRIVRR
ncbi:MAG: hypothetical protein NC201_07535 [Prevotella sp.]|nr:hypothetical protein [Bacteroides sp.]MCM1367079.1 hypothetical protein [Prevotella sp.]MCM1437552.1 hypothetical protein [Prevotella sp.]